MLERPYIPGENTQLLVAKYGRIEQPVLEYDYPVHILDSDEEGFVLSGERLIEFTTLTVGFYPSKISPRLAVSAFVKLQITPTVKTNGATALRLTPIEA